MGVIAIFGWFATMVGKCKINTELVRFTYHIGPIVFLVLHIRTMLIR